MSSYWQKFVNARISRRRALVGAASAGVGAAALSLVGCGGGGSGSGGDNASSANSNVISDANAIAYLWQQPDTTSKAVAGGNYTSFSGQDVTGTLDPMTSPSFTTVDTMGATVYETLLKGNNGPGMDPRSDDGRKIVGNLAEKYEVSDDAVTYTLHMRQGVKFQNVAPVSGRAMTMDDWKSSFDRYMASSPFKATLIDEIDQIQTPDANTMVIKLKQPSAAFLRTLTSARSSILILPKELNDKPDLAATTPIGTRWMILDKLQPSVTREYARHDDYWAGKPYIERWAYPIIPEYQNQYAQFVTGHVLDFTYVKQTDVLQVHKTDAPKARMVKSDPGNFPQTSFFGYQDLDTAAWKDVRVRQAMRMSVDWKAMRAYFANSADFESAGVPVESRTAGFICSGGRVDYPYWLDPEKGELGDASKFFLYDLAAAKQLMHAAGFDNPVEINAYQHNGPQYGPVYQEQGDITVDGWNKSGLFKVNMTRLPYPQFLDQMYQKRDFKGIAINQYDFAYAEVDLNLFNWYHSQGGRFHWMKGDTKLDDMIMSQRREIDDKKRTSIIHDIQKYMASGSSTAFGVIPGDGVSGAFYFQWPSVQNLGWYPEQAYKTWIDKTQPPFV